MSNPNKRGNVKRGNKWYLDNVTLEKTDKWIVARMANKHSTVLFSEHDAREFVKFASKWLGEE